MKPLNHLFHTVRDTFGRCARRFPVTLVFALALTALLLWLVATDWKGEDKLLSVLFYYLSVGTLLSLSLHLWAEEVTRRGLRVGVQWAAPVLLAVDAVFLYYNIEGTRTTDIIVAHGAAILAIGLSVFFLSFFRERDDIPAWNFAQTVVGTLALTIIVGAVMSGGLSLLTFSLHQLFGVDVNNKCYLYILIICSELLPLLMFLGLLPEKARKHDCQPQPTAFLQGTIRYLFLPLAGLYLLVLYVYAGTIIARWELPNGWVSWLVVALMAGCIAIEFGLYPSRIKYDKPADHRIARWLPLLALPLLVLMTVGIGRRFLDYGITINRLYLATLNLWFYFVCIGLIAGRARRLSWIPISFSIVFLLTSVLPVNYASITRNTLHGEVKEALAQSKEMTLPLNEAQYARWLSTIPQAKARQINEKLYYLSDFFGNESIADLVDRDISFYHIREEYAPDSETLHYSPQLNGVAIPAGYSQLTPVSLHRTISGDSLKNDVYSIPLPCGQDTVCIPKDTLRSRDKNATLPAPAIRSRRGNVLILSGFHFYQKGEEAQLNLDGYLFHNQEQIIQPK